MIDSQVADVKSLTRKAGVRPTITRFSGASHPVLQEIAPGERKFGEPLILEAPAAQPSRPNQRGHGGSRSSAPNPRSGNASRRGNRSRGGEPRSYTTTSSRPSGSRGR
jgi:hypothetical protein